MEAITVAGLIAFLKTKVVFLVIGAGIPLAWTFLKKFIPGQVEKHLGGLLKQALDPNTKDPKLKELIHEAVFANIKLVEYLIPESGVGERKKAMVQAALLGVFKNQAVASLLSDTIDLIVKAADDELKEVAEEARKKIEEDKAKPQ